MVEVAEGQSPDPREWLITECAARLAESIQAMVSGPCQAAWLAEAAPEPAPSVWWRQPLSLGAGAEIWVGAAEADWLAIGGKALAAAGIGDAEPSDVKGTYHEILTQALSSVAQSIGGRLAREVVCQRGEETSHAPAVPSQQTVEVRFENGDTARLRLVFGEGLLAELRAAESKAAGVRSEAPSGVPASPAADGSRTLDLLLEVELPVSVSFGRAQLPLKDVLKLTTGSIVELNRSVAEPVEVIVNNCVIARGEVVVIEGNYGVRIQQIISRQERLRSLY